jgi:hypothetical protein
MAKKSKKIEKETRRLIEAVSATIRRKNDRYKFKSKKKKVIKQVKRTCVHWIIRKGKEVPTVVNDNGQWKCQVCGATFPIKPLEAVNGKSAYEIETEKMLALVNQIQFWSVKLGGDAEDTKMFLQLRKMLPRYAKVSKQILKRVNTREEYENRSKSSDIMSQFDAYSGFNYR